MSEQPQVNLNITDIADAIKCLDYAAEGGAFRGWANIRQVLALRDRLDAFVTAAGAHVAPPEGPQAEGPQAAGPQTPQVKE